MESGNIRGSLSNVPMNCVNCGLPFDLVNNTPYKLNCGHTGCKSCLRKCHKDKTAFECEIDQEKVALTDLRLLQKNIEVIQKLRDSKNKSSLNQLRNNSSSNNKINVPARTPTLRGNLQSSGEMVNILGPTPKVKSPRSPINQDEEYNHFPDPDKIKQMPSNGLQRQNTKGTNHAESPLKRINTMEKNSGLAKKQSVTVQQENIQEKDDEYRITSGSNSKRKPNESLHSEQFDFDHKGISPLEIQSPASLGQNDKLNSSRKNNNSNVNNRNSQEAQQQERLSHRSNFQPNQQNLSYRSQRQNNNNISGGNLSNQIKGNESPPYDNNQANQEQDFEEGIQDYYEGQQKNNFQDQPMNEDEDQQQYYDDQQNFQEETHPQNTKEKFNQDLEDLDNNNNQVYDENNNYNEYGDQVHDYGDEELPQEDFDHINNNNQRDSHEMLLNIEDDGGSYNQQFEQDHIDHHRGITNKDSHYSVVSAGMKDTIKNYINNLFENAQQHQANLERGQSNSEMNNVNEKVKTDSTIHSFVKGEIKIDLKKQAKKSQVEMDPLMVIEDRQLMRMISPAHYEEGNLQAGADDEGLFQAHFIPPSPPSQIKIDIPFNFSSAAPQYSGESYRSQVPSQRQPVQSGRQTQLQVDNNQLTASQIEEIKDQVQEMKPQEPTIENVETAAASKGKKKKKKKVKKKKGKGNYTMVEETFYEDGDGLESQTSEVEPAHVSVPQLKNKLNQLQEKMASKESMYVPPEIQSQRRYTPDSTYQNAAPLSNRQKQQSPIQSGRKSQQNSARRSQINLPTSVQNSARRSQNHMPTSAQNSARNSYHSQIQSPRKSVTSNQRKPPSEVRNSNKSIQVQQQQDVSKHSIQMQTSLQQETPNNEPVVQLQAQKLESHRINTQQAQSHRSQNKDTPMSYREQRTLDRPMIEEVLVKSREFGVQFSNQLEIEEEQKLMPIQKKLSSERTKHSPAKSKEFKEDREEEKVYPNNQEYPKQIPMFNQHSEDDMQHEMIQPKQNNKPVMHKRNIQNLHSSDERVKDQFNSVPINHNRRIQDGMPPFNQSIGKYNFYSLGQNQNHNSQAFSEQDFNLPQVYQQVPGSANQMPKLINQDRPPYGGTPVAIKNQNFGSIPRPPLTTTQSQHNQTQSQDKILNPIGRQIYDNASEPSQVIRSSSLQRPDFLQYQLENLEKDIQQINQHLNGSDILDPEDEQQYYNDPLRQSPMTNYRPRTQNEILNPNVSNFQPYKKSNASSEQQSPSVIREQAIIQPLAEQCKNHPREQVKYFCRDIGCLKPLCPDCIIEHAKHDFVAANELASVEMKALVKQTERKCKRQIKIQKELKSQTERRLSDLNRQRREEFQKIHCYFMELHKELDERELQLNSQFNESVKIVESQLMKDIQSISQTYAENLRLFKQLKQLQDQYQISSEVGIVASSEIVYKLNNAVGSRDNQHLTQGFYVTSDDAKKDIMAPVYNIQLKQEKERIMQIGKFVWPNEENSEQNITTIIEGENNTPKKISKNKSLFTIPEERKSQLESKNNSSLDHINHSHSHSRKNKEIVEKKDAQTQTNGSQPNIPLIPINQAAHPSNSAIIQRQDSVPLLETGQVQPNSLHWFKWDSFDVFKFDPQKKEWNIRKDIKHTSKFLFFSSIVHLPNNQGCFLMGGSDNEDNYSKRVQYFCKYNLFIEKPHMIHKRAFFPSVFSKLDNSIYVLGGSDSNSSDLNHCEKFSLAENLWRPISPMKLSRNGTAAVIMDQYRIIFVFGGNNHKHGSLSKIEKYEVDFDKWSIIDIHLKKSIHDLQAFNLGRERVLVFGGHTNSDPSNEVQLIDLSLECLKTRNGRLLLKEGGKSYLNPAFDSSTGKLMLFFGYCDDKPKIEELDLTQLTLFNVPALQQKGGQELNQSLQRQNSRKSQSMGKPPNHQIEV